MAKQKLGKSVWSGTLSLGLLAVPVKAYTSRASDSTYKTRSLHATCRAPIKQERFCSKCKSRDLAESDVTTCIEVAENALAEVTKSKPEKQTDIKINAVITAESVDWSYLAGKTHILVPAGGADAYAVLYKTLEEMGACGVAEATISRSRAWVFVRAWEGLLLLQRVHSDTLAKDLQPFIEAAGVGEASRKEIVLCKRLVRDLMVKWNDLELPDEEAEKLARQVEKRENAGDLIYLDGKPAAASSLAETLEKSLKGGKGKQKKGKRRA